MSKEKSIVENGSTIGEMIWKNLEDTIEAAKVKCLQEFFHIYLCDPIIIKELVDAKSNDEVYNILKKQCDKMHCDIMFGKER